MARSRRADYVEFRLKLRKHFKTYSVHHMIPRSRRGGEYKHNLFPWDDRPHAAWHGVFRHMTIQEIWKYFDEIHGRIFTGDSRFVVPLWWSVCPFIDKEKHIPRKPVERSFLTDTWLDCFGTSDPEKSRLLLKMMLLFFIFDGALYDTNGSVSLERLKRIIRRLKPGSERHWAFRSCFDEEPKGDCEQALRVVRMVQHIFSHSPYIPRK